MNPTYPGQGALACEVRKDDNHSRELIESINVLDDYKCPIKKEKFWNNMEEDVIKKLVSFFNTHFGVMHASKGLNRER